MLPWRVGKARLFGKLMYSGCRPGERTKWGYPHGYRDMARPKGVRAKKPSNRKGLLQIVISSTSVGHAYYECERWIGLGELGGGLTSKRIGKKVKSNKKTL